METNENDITITKYFTIISFHDCELMFFFVFYENSYYLTCMLSRIIFWAKLQLSSQHNAHHWLAPELLHLVQLSNSCPYCVEEFSSWYSTWARDAADSFLNSSISCLWASRRWVFNSAAFCMNKFNIYSYHDVGFLGMYCFIELPLNFIIVSSVDWSRCGL